MVKFSIEYNPYIAHCMFLKNGAKLKSSSKLNIRAEERLQLLFDEQDDWLGLIPEIVNECNDKEIKLTFIGRGVDFSDIEYAINDYLSNNKDIKINIIFERYENNNVLKDLERVINDIKASNDPAFYVRNCFGKTIFETFDDLKSGLFEISVMATMSSGKSTLINALLHNEILPSKNQACTATITKIYDKDGFNGYEAVCFDDNENIVYDSQQVDLTKMVELNEDSNVRTINIVCDIPFVGSKNLQLCINDTPGPNNSNDATHSEITHSMIKTQDAIVVYVMDATQISTNDAYELLLSISSEMKKYGKQSRDKFIFVINKFDQIEDEEIESMLENAREYLKGFGIENPTIIPICARLALSIWKKENGIALNRTEKSILRDLSYYNEAKYPIDSLSNKSPSVENKNNELVENYRLIEDEEEREIKIALVHSGLPVLEFSIAEYMEKYILPSKIYAAVKDIQNLVKKIKQEQDLENLIRSDCDEISKIEKELSSLESNQKKREKLIEEFEKQVDSLKDYSIFNPNIYLKELNRTMGSLISQYSGKNRLSQKEGFIVLTNFKSKMDSSVKRLILDLSSALEKKINDDCKSILKMYKSKIKKIFEDISLPGFDLILDDFTSIDMLNIDDVLSDNVVVEVKTITETYYNPRRSGFFGWFRFWKPKYINKVIEKKEEYVDIEEIVVQLVNKFRTEITDSIHNACEAAKLVYEKYKKNFKKQIRKMKKQIDDTIDSYNQKLENKDIICCRVKENEEYFDWINSIYNSFERILGYRYDETRN